MWHKFNLPKADKDIGPKDPIHAVINCFYLAKSNNFEKAGLLCGYFNLNFCPTGISNSLQGQSVMDIGQP